MGKYQITTLTALRRSFWDAYPEFKDEYRKTWRQNRYRCDIRVSFIDHVENLRRSNDISDRLAYRATL